MCAALRYAVFALNPVGIYRGGCGFSRSEPLETVWACGRGHCGQRSAVRYSLVGDDVGDRSGNAIGIEHSTDIS